MDWETQSSEDIVIAGRKVIQIVNDEIIRRMLLHFGIALAAIGLLAAIGYIWGYSGVLALLAAATLTYALISMFFIDGVSFFLTLLFTASIMPMVASNVYIEFGNFISEQGIYGIPNGATIRLVLYCLIFLGAMYLTVRSLTLFIKPSLTNRACISYARWSYLLHIAVIMISCGVLLVYGAPLLRGEDRFAYWAQVPSVFDRLPYLIGLVSFSTAVAIVIDPRRRKLVPLTLFAANIGVLLLFSDKFTALFTVFILTVSGFYTARIYLKHEAPRLARLLIFTLGTLVALLFVAAMGYLIFYDYTLENVGAKLIDRAFGLQGHMWYGVDRAVLVSGSSGNWSHIFPPYGYTGHSGMELLMYQVADSSFIDRVLAQGVRFTMAGQALPVFVFGYGWATIYQVLAGVLSGLTISYLVFSISRLNLLSIMVASAGVRQATNAFMMGDAGDLYKPLTLAIMIWIAADLIWHFSQRRRRSKASSKLVTT